MAKHTKRGDLALMQYADDELSTRERTALDGELDDEARTKLEALGELRELVAGRLAHDADAVPAHKFAAMWREIDKSVDAEAPKGVFGKIAAWLDRHRGHVITGMVSAGAVAAIALVMRPGSSRDAGSSRSIEVLPAAMRAAPVVESLDTPDGSGAVMNFEDEDGHTTVIWVTPADTVEGI
ncbi:MAG TPA: hypothetical protein VK427_03890 [Kofleriaceae bacterium]|nr:hypothetical protein [Kofleriaceae bacterium]